MLLTAAAATTPLPPPPSTAFAIYDTAIGAVGSIPPPPPSATTDVDKGGGGTLASDVTIAEASINVTVPLTLLSMVGCCVVAPRLLQCLPSKFVSPRRCDIIDAFAAGPPSPFAYHQQSLSCRSFTEYQLLLPHH
jgi:hypothetical protein